VGFELPGVVVEMQVNVGDLVETGQVLARLDPVRMEARRDEIIASVREAGIQYKLATTTSERVRRIRSTNALSAQAEDEAVTAQEEAEARLARAEAQLASVEVDIAKSVLHAPYAATVESKLADLGSTVSAGQPLLSLIGRDGLELRFTLPTDAAAEMRIGERVSFTSGEISAQGVLVRIRESRDTTTRAMDGFLELDAETSKTLVPGTMVSVRWPVEIPTPGFWLSRSALTEGTRGLWACYIVDAGKLQRIDLEWLHASGDRVFVRGNLSDGDLVVSEGLHRLTPGMTVGLTNAAAETR
jgi:RND family efflux transporter MFP subunit